MAFASPNQEDEPESPTEPTNPPDTQPTGAPETNPTPTPPEAPLPTPTPSPYYPVNPNPDMNPEDLFGLLARFLCFSGDTEVLTLDGEYKRLYDLNVGDYVLSSNLKYTKIIGWLHKIPTLEAKFLKIYLNNGPFLKITEKHLIYKADCSAFSTTSVVNKHLIFAEELSIGDCLYVVDQTISNVVIQRIEKIETITETGVYAPETSSGDIVVNGIIASCYTEVKKHVVINIFKEINFYTNQFISWFYGDINTPTELIDLPLTANLIINTIDGILPLKIFLN